jgi:hypothetical protein
MKAFLLSLFKSEASDELIELYEIGVLALDESMNAGYR